MRLERRAAAAGGSHWRRSWPWTGGASGAGPGSRPGLLTLAALSPPLLAKEGRHGPMFWPLGESKFLPAPPGPASLSNGESILMRLSPSSQVELVWELRVCGVLSQAQRGRAGILEERQKGCPGAHAEGLSEKTWDHMEGSVW